MQDLTVAEGSQPLVSVVTPVYNGEHYLKECIESILAQTYDNWEYIILNNASQDGSRRIAQAFAEKDPRIRLHDNEDVLPMVRNWNRAIEYISDQSKYCKIVHADDLLFPHCIENMVGLAEENPTVGIVGAYVLEGTRVKCDGLHYPSAVIGGSEVCGSTLNRKYYLFGSPSSLLIRSDLIRKRTPFYQERYLQVVDQEVCYYLLQNTDFGFVHNVLTYSRLHDNSVTSSVTPLNRLIIEELTLLVEYGPIYLSATNYKQCLSKRMEAYYKFLGSSIFKNKDKNFWNFHREGLHKIDITLSSGKLAQAAVREILKKTLILTSHPVQTIKTVTTQNG
jgi:glycosyltransferase involved in cell wall biosynthesis